MELTGPIIIIGCGRSGSTLLDRVFNAHPDLHMLGETNFLTADLWDALRKSSERSMWNSQARQAYANRGLFSSSFEGGAIAFDGEEQRIGTIVCRTVCDLFELDRIDKKFWGMKEIWNGDAKDVDWKIYDWTYPDALWVHVVRHPFSYVRSAIGWNGKENDEENIACQLRAWSRIVRKSRERAACGRWIELRYEDLLSDPRGVLQRVLDKLGLDWNVECLRPLQQNWVATKALPSIDTETFRRIVGDLDLRELIEDLGYGIDGLFDQQATSYSREVNYDSSGNIVIDAGIQRGVGPYWIFALSTSPAVRDEIERVRSGYTSLIGATILENGLPLARWPVPGRFYEAPQGSYFCNDGAIVFTSSDGSDPATNGRSYSISFWSESSDTHYR